MTNRLRPPIVPGCQVVFMPPEEWTNLRGGVVERIDQPVGDFCATQERLAGFDNLLKTIGHECWPIVRLFMCPANPTGGFLVAFPPECLEVVAGPEAAGSN